MYKIILEPEYWNQNTGTRIKSPRKKYQNGRTLFPDSFYYKDFFPQGFFRAKILDFMGVIVNQTCGELLETTCPFHGDLNLIPGGF